MIRKQTKAELRRAAKEARDRMAPSLRAQESEAICRRILSSEVYRDAKSVRFFAAIGSEADLSAAAMQALADGKSVSYPCVSGRDLVFRRIRDLSELRPAGAYRIPEPGPECPPDEEERALILVPGLLYDLNGSRIGYGGGYYDRYLEHISPEGSSVCGVCFDEQISSEPLPATSRDIRTARIFTPTAEHVIPPHERSPYAEQNEL